MENLVVSEKHVELYVWVDPNNFMANWNLNIVGTFTSTPDNIDSDNLMFIPNPGFNGFVSPFQGNLLWSYLAEYNLELCRREYFKNYPSRLRAIFLFETKEEAFKYRERNPWHVGKRELKAVKTVNKYYFSRHDCSWIDFLRLPYGKEEETISLACSSYWKGETVKQCRLLHGDKPWSEAPIFEVLLIGRVDLVNNKEDNGDV